MEKDYSVSKLFLEWLETKDLQKWESRLGEIATVEGAVEYFRHAIDADPVMTYKHLEDHYVGNHARFPTGLLDYTSELLNEFCIEVTTKYNTFGEEFTIKEQFSLIPERVGIPLWNIPGPRYLDWDLIKKYIDSIPKCRIEVGFEIDGYRRATETLYNNGKVYKLENFDYNSAWDTPIIYVNDMRCYAYTEKERDWDWKPEWYLNAINKTEKSTDHDIKRGGKN